MLHANEMWQIDTFGPYVYDTIKGQMKKIYLIAFIDDASRLNTHAEFFFLDDERPLTSALQVALSKNARNYINGSSSTAAKANP